MGFHPTGLRTDASAAVSCLEDLSLNIGGGGGVVCFDDAFSWQFWRHPEQFHMDFPYENDQPERDLDH